MFYLKFQHYVFNLESRHLLNLSVQNAMDCISENFNFKNLPGTPLEMLHHWLYYISRPPLSQNPPAAPTSLPKFHSSCPFFHILCLVCGCVRVGGGTGGVPVPTPFLLAPASFHFFDHKML